MLPVAGGKASRTSRQVHDTASVARCGRSAPSAAARDPRRGGRAACCHRRGHRRAAAGDRLRQAYVVIRAGKTLGLYPPWRRLRLLRACLVFSASHAGLPLKNGQDLCCNLLCEQGRDGVAELRLDAGAVADELEVVREGEEPLDLGDAQPAVVPVERADVRAGLGLDRGRGPGRVELQQERPVAAAPLEQRLGVAASRRCSAGSSRPAGFWEQVRVLPAQDLSPGSGSVSRPASASPAVTCGCRRSRWSRRSHVAGVAGFGQVGQPAGLRDSDDEQPRSA